MKRNYKKKYNDDCLIKILEDAGKPLHIDKIIKLSKKLYPEIPVKKTVISSCIQKYRSTFVSIGRTSTYGLKKWEKEKENFRGGSIRSIVDEYLKKFSEPKHLRKVTAYVKKFRPDTNENSICSSIQQIKPQRFLMRNGYIGLPGMKYDTSFFDRKPGLFMQKTSFHYDFENWCLKIKKFRQANKGSLPSAVSKRLTERSLYYFMKRARKASVKNRLNAEQMIQLKNLSII